MKKFVIMIAMALAFQGALPVHAQNTSSWRLPKFRMPQLSMPSVSYEGAKQRLDAAKNRVMQALNTNKREVILAAVGALLVALGIYATAQRRQQAPKAGGIPLPTETVQEKVTRLRGLLDDKNADATEVVTLLQDIVSAEYPITEDIVKGIAEAPIAQNEKNRAILKNYLLSAWKYHENVNIQYVVQESFARETSEDILAEPPRQHPAGVGLYEALVGSSSSPSSSRQRVSSFTEENDDAYFSAEDE